MSAQAVRAVIYLRISLDRNNDGLAIDRQREECERIAREKGWVVVETYVDRSKSATNKTKIRPDYDRMVSDHGKNRFDAIICYDLDRLTRQPRQLEDWIDAAEDRGLLLTTANGEADLTTDGGRMYARIKAAVARAEVERKSERQSGAQAQRAKQGRAPKGIRPLGYAINGDVIEDEAAAVRGIYEAFRRKSSLRALAAALSGETGENIPKLPALPRHTQTLALERNERRAQANETLAMSAQLEMSPVPEDAPWSPSTILGMLRNPRYAGYSTYTPKHQPAKEALGNKRRSWRASILRDEANEPVRGQWDRIVEEDLWWTVQEILDEPGRVTNRSGTDRRHIGSGLYLCGTCDAPVRGHSSRYRCAGHVMRSRDQIDTFVQIAVREVLGSDDLADLLPTTDEPRLNAIKEELSQHRAKLLRAQRDYDDEVIEGRDLKRIRDREEASIVMLESERILLSAGSIASPVLGAKDPVTAFDESDLATKRGVIDALCEVRLFPHPRGVKKFDPDTVQITWREWAKKEEIEQS